MMFSLLVILVLSIRSKSETQGMVIGFCVLVVPMLIDLYGSHIVRYFSFVNLLTPNLFVNRFGISSGLFILEVVVVSAVVLKTQLEDDYFLLD